MPDTMKDRIAHLFAVHPDLVSLADGTIIAAKRCFPDARLVLSVVGDGEDAHLLLTIWVAEDANSAMERLTRFDREWWQEAGERGGGLLRVAVEFL